jgi:hypothetical protein
MKPELAAVAGRQRGVFRRAQARAARYDDAHIERLVRTGVWQRVRHGIYTAQPYDEALVRSDRRVHLLAAAARMLAIGGDTVLSHGSAAIWHRLELLGEWPVEPTLTLAQPRGSRLTAHGYAVAPVPERHRVPRADVTTAARTVVDIARATGRASGLVTAESALRAGLNRAALAAVLSACRGWPGAPAALAIVDFADEFSETALESLARLWCHDQGLPPPRQQRTVRTLDGRFVAEVDFVWDECRTVLETDGRKKYNDPQGLARGGVVWKEKLREDRLRDCGLEVVRGYWSDGDDGGAQLAGRLRRAFARGLRATGDREYTLGPAIRTPARPLAGAG